MIEPSYQAPINKTRPLALLSAATLLLATLGAVSPSPSAAATVCPAPHPEGCMVRCLAHKRRCVEACRVRKHQCIQKVRVQAKACMLDCRGDDSVADPGACKRRCIARAKELAKTECLADRPVCLKECNPQGCRRRCAHADRPVDAPVYEPIAAPVDEPGTVPALESVSEEPVRICEPPVDNECLDDCARDLRSCAQLVHADVRRCVRSCGELRGDERRVCMGDCLASAREGGKACSDAFHECVSGCREGDPGTDPVIAE